MSAPATTNGKGSAAPPGARWNKGRAWDGIGPWCDDATAEEICLAADELFFADKRLTVVKAIKFLLPTCGEKRALTYLDGKGHEIEVQTFSDVMDCADRIAAYLQREMSLRPGDRAVLLYPPGQEFILAFLGCIVAGVVAVPVYPPHPYRMDTDLPRLNMIVKNSGCKVALTDSQYMLVIRGIAVKNMLSRVGLAKGATWPNLRNVQTDKIRKSYAHTELIVVPDPNPDDLAFLQYTSGSTSLPKGVMVTHANLIAQIRLISLRSVGIFGYTNQLNVVSWLPQYHDMGLIGIFLECLSTGTHLIYMTPISFLQDPTMWLYTLHRYRAAVTCAPNFAFALAQRKTPEALRDSMDLSCIQCVICGAEPIRVEVMQSFFAFFAKSKFDPKVLMPAYGLAEFTLCATSQPSGKVLNVLYVDQQVLGSTGKIVLVPEDTPGAACYVGVGGPYKEDGTQCRIVNPDTRECQGQGYIGEIWLDGPSKTRGYFDDEVKTQESFRGLIKGEEDSGHVYLQTGDQGFLWNDELFITGRIKDLIIVRGRNLYPQDIEYAVEAGLESMLRPGCSGSFSLDCNGEETVAYVAELRANTTDRALLQGTVDQIRRLIAEEFQVAVSVVMLVEPRSIPKTTSGKIQRHKCKLGYRDGSLKTAFLWEAAGSAKGLALPPPPKLDVLALSLSSQHGDDDAMSDDSFVSATFGGAEFEDDFSSPETNYQRSPLKKKTPLPPSSLSGMAPIKLPPLGEVPAATGSPAEEGGQQEEQEEAETMVGADNWDVPSPVALQSGSKQVGEGEDGEEGGITKEHQRFIDLLVEHVVKTKEMQKESVDIDQPMSLLGFDSAGFVALGRVMGEWVGKEISPAIVYKYTTIREIAGFLSRGADDSELSNGDTDDAIEADLEAPIAIVGMGVRAPGGPTGNLIGKEAFWKFTMAGADAVREDMPVERKTEESLMLPGGYIDNVDAFDAHFFGMSPAEAAHLDYHQGHALEVTWQALEDAGIEPASLSGRKVGVYIGAISHEFAVLESLRGESSTWAATGISNSLVANRVSYMLNVRGPSLTLDTACSSSLVTINDAVRDLRLGVISTALAGGVNLILSSSASTALKKAGFLSTACRTFDATGDGYCRGEGCGMVVLKRLSRAIADGDRVYSVIRGIAVNHDGKTTSLTAPNPLAQEAVLRAAYRDAHVSPSQVRYVEAHGTGTKLGDSIEMAALGAVMQAGRDREDGSKFRCIVASVKSNIGHLEAAAGVMGLIRCALILYHGQVPKAVHFEQPNPLIPWERLPFIIPRANMPLLEDGADDDPGATVVAGVSAFGFGGTNAHCVLESVPKNFDFDEGFDTAVTASSTSKQPLPLLLPVSARSEEALKKLVGSYMDLLVGSGKEGSGKVLSYDRAVETCLEASTRRTHHYGFRVGATGRSAEELQASLKELVEEGETKPVSKTAQSPEVVFLFTGQGAGYKGMGRQLYERNAVFRASMDEVDALLTPHLGFSVLKTVVLAKDDYAVGGTTTLESQPTLFAIEYSLTRVWAMLGVEPNVVMGHSVGEIVASVLAGVLSLADAAKLICVRAKAMHAVPAGRGGMSVVFVGETAAQALCESYNLEIAAVNGDNCVTIAGAFSGLDAMQEHLKSKDIRFKRLDVGRAFHTSHMESALPSMLEIVNEIKVKTPKSTPKLVSLLSGGLMTEAPGAEHWADHVRKPVLFLQGMRSLLQDGRPRVFIELGPDAALTAMAKRIVPAKDTHVALIPSMTQARREDENLRLAEAFGKAYVAGVNLKFRALKVGPPMPSSVELPLYPFDNAVHIALGKLTAKAMATIGEKPTQAQQQVLAASADAQRLDYGKTNLFEESWLLRQEHRGARGKILPPAHTVYICSEPTDAAALASVKVLTERSHTVLVPQDSESAAKAALGEDHPNKANVVGVDLLAGGDELKAFLSGPNEADTIAIVYIAGGESGGQAPGLEDLSRLTDTAFGESAQMLCLLRNVAEMGQGKRIKIWVVTTRAKTVAPGDRVQSMSAPLWALGKSAMQESYPSMWVCMMDLPGPSKDQLALLPSSTGNSAADLKLAVPAAARLLQLLDTETSSYGRNDPPEQLVFRRGQWLTQKLREAELQQDIIPAVLKKIEEATRANVFPPPGVEVVIRKTLTPDAWYLVTGGLGGLGLHAANSLVRHGATKLILTSRGGKPTAQYKGDLDAISSIPGVTIRPFACDTGERAAVFKMFQEFENDGGIRGVVHCAGILADGNLRQQDVDKLGAVWGGKVDGAVNLHMASVRQARPLDLWITYSSSSALMGSPGQSNYSAANTALDCIAALRRQAGLVGTSFQWGVWVGVGFAEPAFLDQLDSVGFPSITKSLGSLVLTALLNRSAMAMPKVVCCHPVKWSVFVQRGPEYMMSGDLECFEPVKNRIPPKQEPVPLTDDMKAYGALESPVERTEMVENVLISSLKKATGKEITKTQNLGDCGIASLEAVELIETLIRRFPVNIALGKLLEYPTVESLSKYVGTQLDRIVDSKRSLPLSRGQELLLAQGLSRSYIYQEMTFHGPLAPLALVEAWRQLLGRHPVLRTILDLKPAEGIGRQQTLPIEDTPYKEMYGSVFSASKAKDTHSLEVVLGNAADTMNNIPGARLLSVKLATKTSTNPKDSTILLAVPRMLLDRWSLRLLGSELTGLYMMSQAVASAAPGAAGPTLSPPLMSYHEAMRQAATKEPQGGSPSISAGARASLRSGASSVGSEKARTLVPMSITGLTESSKPKDDSQSTSLTLPPALAAELSAYAIKSRIPPSTVLLSAFLLSLWERSENTEASVLVDLDQRVARGDVVGPVLVPFNVTLQRAHASRGPGELAYHVRETVDETLQLLQAPSTRTTEGPLRPIPEGVPGFAFQEVPLSGMEIGAIGDKKMQGLQLSVVSRLAADKKNTEYVLNLASGPGHAMTDLGGFMSRLAFNTREVLLPTASRKKKDTPFQAPVAKTGAVGAAGMLAAKGGVPMAIDLGSAAAAAGVEKQVLGTPLPTALVALLQLVGTGIIGTVLAVPILLVWPLVTMALSNLGQAVTLALVPVFYHLIGLIVAGEVLILRELLTRGSLLPGDYAVNSVPFLRWWFMTRLLALTSPVYVDHMKGTIVYIWWLRALGATVGDKVRFHAGVVLTDPDLVKLGDDVLLGKGARLISSIVRDGVLRRGLVVVGERAHVGTHAVMMPGSQLGRDSLLDRLSVAVEGQQLAENSVYESSPSRFRRPRDDVDTAAHQGDTPGIVSLDVFSFVLQAFLAPVLATLAASIAYQPTAALAVTLKLFPFFNWSTWPEGPVIFALFSTIGVVPMTAFPTLFASMGSLRATAALLPDRVLLYTARQAFPTIAITADAIRNQLTTQEGVEIIRGVLPAGMTLEGNPETDTMVFVTTGAQAVKEVMLDAFGLPAARMYGVFGIVWIFALGFMIQGFILTFLTNLVYYLLLAPPVSSNAYRVRGFKAHLRQIKISVLRWAYDRFMRLFVGTDFLPTWYWTLGARVGRNVVIANTDVFEDPHLISLGDQCTITDFAALETVNEPGNGYAVCGRVKVGKDCVVGVRGVVAPGTEMSDGSIVMPQSVVAGGVVAPDAVMMGVPAVKILDRLSLPGNAPAEGQGGGGLGGCLKWGLGSCGYDWLVMRTVQGVLAPLLSCGLTLLLVLVSAYPSVLFYLWAMAEKDANGAGWPVLLAQVATPIAFLMFWVSILVVVVVQKWVLRWRQTEGMTVPVRGPSYHARIQTLVFQNYAGAAALETLRGSVLAPWYLWLLGAKVDGSAYVNTLLITEPDLVTVGKQAVLDTDAVLMSNALEGRSLVLGPIVVEDHARIGSASLMLRNCSVKRGAELAETAVLPPTLSLRVKGVRYGAFVLEDPPKDDDAV